MKRTTLLRHLRRQGCTLLREGRRHSIWIWQNARGDRQPMQLSATELIQSAYPLGTKLPFFVLLSN